MKLLETIDYCIELAHEELHSVENQYYTDWGEPNPPNIVASLKVEAEIINTHIKNLKTLRSSCQYLENSTIPFPDESENFPTPIVPDENIEMFKTYAGGS